MNSPQSHTAKAKKVISVKPLIILASQSPQRKALLYQVGLNVHCCPVNIDETPLTSESPSDLVVRLALTKARQCFEKQDTAVEPKQGRRKLILGADTTIDLDNASLGKPSDESEALDMLSQLAGREHLVHTGICVFDASKAVAQTQLITTVVRFGSISAEQAKHYWDSGEPVGKAGGYGIQGLGAQFVAHLSGSYSNVVGLPLYETLQLVEKVAK